MKQTVDIIEDIVNELTPTITINSQSTTDGIITLLTDKTYWIHTASRITIDGKKYRVVDFVIDESLSLKPFTTGDTVDVDSFVLPKPTYFHGTEKMIRQEVNSIKDKTTIVPMIWLKEIYRDDQVFDAESAIDRETDLMLIFVDSADTENWLTDDHYTNVIYPIDKMVDLFIEKLGQNRFFTETFNFERTNLVNLSTEGLQRSSIFDFNLSGKMIRLFAQIRKDFNCN